MEVREGNVIINVDETLDQDKKDFVGCVARLVNWIVKEKNKEILELAVGSMARISMLVRIMKETIGEEI